MLFKTPCWQSSWFQLDCSDSFFLYLFLWAQVAGKNWFCGCRCYGVMLQHLSSLLLLTFYLSRLVKKQNRFCFPQRIANKRHGQKHPVAFIMPISAQGLSAMGQQAASSQCESVLFPQGSATPQKGAWAFVTLLLWPKLSERIWRERREFLTGDGLIKWYSFLIKHIFCVLWVIPKGDSFHWITC